MAVQASLVVILLVLLSRKTWGMIGEQEAWQKLESRTLGLGQALLDHTWGMNGE